MKTLVFSFITLVMMLLATSCSKKEKCSEAVPLFSTVYDGWEITDMPMFISPTDSILKLIHSADSIPACKTSAKIQEAHLLIMLNDFSSAVSDYLITHKTESASVNSNGNSPLILLLLLLLLFGSSSSSRRRK